MSNILSSLSPSWWSQTNYQETYINSKARPEGASGGNLNMNQVSRYGYLPYAVVVVVVVLALWFPMLNWIRLDSMTHSSQVIFSTSRDSDSSETVMLPPRRDRCIEERASSSTRVKRQQQQQQQNQWDNDSDDNNRKKKKKKYWTSWAEGE